MAGEAISITSLDIDTIVSRFERMPRRIRDHLRAANRDARARVLSALEALYGPRLARLWIVDIEQDKVGTLARLQVQTSDPRVLRYEFGTRPHLIVATNARALHWNNPNSAFAKYVHHPGTRAHNKRQGLEEELVNAITAWQVAIAEAIVD